MITRNVGQIVLIILKTLVWLLLSIVKLVLEAAKLFLLLFSIIARIFLGFVKAATP